MNLEIKAPCPENWAGMTPGASGRFCSSCAKSVHDFTDKPKEELLAFLLCSTQSPCVRMLASQQRFTPEEVQHTAQKLMRSGKAIPAAALALVMLLAVGCTPDSKTAASTTAAFGTTDSAIAVAGALPTDTPQTCAPTDTNRQTMILGRLVAPIAPPENKVPEEPVVLGEPVLMGAPPMPLMPDTADREIMGDVAMPPAK